MDEREAEYLRQCIRESERSNRRWKAATFGLLVLLTILMIPGAVAVVGLAGRARMQAEQAQIEAQMQAERAAQQARQAEQAARSAQPPQAAGEGTRKAGTGGSSPGGEAAP